MELNIRDAFPPADLADWTAQVERDLKGRPFTSLVSTQEGLEVKPYYGPDDAPQLPALVPGPRPHGWTVASACGHPDQAEAAEQIARDVARGVTGIDLELGAGGLVVEDVESLDAVLEAADLEAVDVCLRAGGEFEATAGLLIDLWDRRECDPEAVRGWLGADPLSAFARTGSVEGGLDGAFGTLAELSKVVGAWPGVRAVTIDTPYHAAGATEVDDLGLTLATAVESLRRLTEAGLSVDQACGQLSLSVTLGRDVYAGVAKLRAARLLWARVVEASGGSAASQSVPVLARCSARWLTRRDPWVNVLRATLATFAGAVGGADRITVTPFDAISGGHATLGRRLARNTQLVLKHEAHLGAVLDPAAGSYFFDRLTHQMASGAWAVLQEVEGEGGMEEALRLDWVAERVQAAHEARAARIATRRVPVTGVSEFPLLSEPPPPDPAPDPGEGPFPVRRLAEPFEALRARADSEDAPRVFVASLGPLAVHTARSTWIANLLAAGGIAAEVPDGYETVDAAVEAFRASGASIVAVCSADSRYAEDLPALLPALRAAGAKRILLAGRPNDASGDVDTHVHVGADVLEILVSLWEGL